IVIKVIVCGVFVAGASLRWCCAVVDFGGFCGASLCCAVVDFGGFCVASLLAFYCGVDFGVFSEFPLLLVRHFWWIELSLSFF
ncbi:11830_t:CDS:1, partial [Dentiscutata erythropus]